MILPPGTESVSYTHLSHLDSVVEGGEYDGAVGVFSGLLILEALREAGYTQPVRVAAFRCEESSNFKICTIGSGLITGSIEKERLKGAVAIDGRPLEEHMAERGFTLNVPRIKGIRQYIEIHIEQGRVLEDAGKNVGVVTAIAAPHRYLLTLEGLSEHSGATPMKLRRDALCGAAEMILEVERIGREESFRHSVATVGAIENHPNVMNSVPGFVKMQIDMRGIHDENICRMEKMLKEKLAEICSKRALRYDLKKTDEKKPVILDRQMIDDLAEDVYKRQVSGRQIDEADDDALRDAQHRLAGRKRSP